MSQNKVAQNVLKRALVLEFLRSDDFFFIKVKKTNAIKVYR